jgi:hypothetical protein
MGTLTTITNSTLSRRRRDIVDGHGGELDSGIVVHVRYREELEAIIGPLHLLA